MLAKVIVTLKPGVLDPQGQTIQHALNSIGFADLTELRTGKYFEIKLNTDSVEHAKTELAKMCEELLSNPVIENYRFEFENEAL